MRRVVAYFLTAVLSCVLFAGQSGRNIARAQGAAPEIRRLGPDTIAAGAPTFTLRVEGRNFLSGAKILLDGAALASSRVTKKGKIILAEIESSVTRQPGAHTVQVMNPDGLTTAPLSLTIVEQAADIDIRLGGSAAQEGLGVTFEINVTGDEFDENSKALVFGFGAETEFISKNTLRIQIAPKFTNDPARVPIMVRGRGGRLSNAEIFFVVPAPADISSIDPDSIEAGSEDFILQVRGDFKSDARILINGMPLATTQPKSGRLEATVPASFRSMPGELIVRVEQGGIQSSDKTLLITPTTGPFIFRVAPARLRQKEAKETIDIDGANFSSDPKVFIDGQEAKVRDSGRRKITVVISAELLASAGTHTIQVTDKDGLTSNTATFEVAPDVEVSSLSGGKRDGFNRDQACVSSEDALFRRPSRLALGPDGFVYVVDHQNHAIRAINPDTGEVCAIAGTGEPGYNDSGNPAGFAPTFSYPLGVAIDADGTIYVTENGNNVVRRIRRNAGGNVTVDTFVGAINDITDKNRQKNLNSTRRGLSGFRDGAAVEAQFRQPDDIVIASDGSIYVSDPGNNAIRRIRQAGGQLVVETFAGNGVPGFADGDAENARFNTPTGLALSDDGQFLFVADTNNKRIRRINLLTRQVETVAGSGATGGDDGSAGEASFDLPIGLAADLDGVLYVSEFRGNRIRRIDAIGNVSTLAGSTSEKLKDGPGSEATFNNPRGIAIDRQRGILYVADFENFRVRRIALR